MAEQKKTKEYGDQSITALRGADRVRLRPAVIFGSDGLEGCQHAFFEILANAADEARAGYGNKIVVTAFYDKSIEVEDNGRGVPMGFNEKEGRWNWELVFCELYAGGKYDTNSSDSAYKYSLGLNGLGACATQYCSEYMTVRSYSPKKREISEMHFKVGEPDGELTVTPFANRQEKKQGTVIRWKPDKKVFNDINIPFEFYDSTMRRQAVVNAGVHFILRHEVAPGQFETHEYYYERGVEEYVSELAGVDALAQSPFVWHMPDQVGRDADDREEYTVRADIAFIPMKRNGHSEYFHNSSFLEYGGSPDRATRLAFVYAVDKYLKAQNKYNKNESKITYQDIEDSLLIVISSSSTVTSYENQTKKSISNIFIQRALTDFMKRQLDYFFIENPTEGAALANAVLVNKRAREKAEVTVSDIKKKLSGNGDAALARVEKFVACRSKDPEVRELFIVEGDSALSSCKLARNSEFQAVIAVRGKTLNCLKASYERIFESPIIVDLLRVIGCGVELKGKNKGDIPTFHLENLRWSKIILCTDADEDGFQIRTLLLTLFYRLLPTLLREERIFIAETPLFEITAGSETYFAYSEAERIEILKKLGNKKYTLQRSKGLGENEPEMMSKTTMHPSTRRLVAVTPTDAEATAVMFDTLLGENIAERKKFIAENSARYRKDADV